MVKTMADWNGSFDECFAIGDLVDEEIVEHFINVLPPACMTGECVQIGSPDFHVAEGATYLTLKNTPDGWMYAGTCLRGSTEHIEFPY